MQFLTRLEADRLAWGYGNFRARAWISANAGFTGTYIKDSKAPQFDAVALSESLFQAFEDRIHRRFSFVARQACAFDDVMDNVLFYQRVHLYFLGIAAGIHGYRDTRKVFLCCQCAK